jgi:hypothetical protein
MNCTLIRIEHGLTQYFYALAPATDVSVKASDPQESGSVAVAQLVGQWLYLSGHEPAGETSELIWFGAGGSKLVLHRVPGSSGNPDRVRAIVLELGTGRTATLSSPDGATTLELTAGEYADGVLNSSGQFASFDGPYPFDPQTTSGSVEIMEDIETEKTARDVD